MDNMGMELDIFEGFFKKKKCYFTNHPFIL